MANADQEDIGTIEVEKDGHFNADDSKFYMFRHYKTDKQFIGYTTCLVKTFNMKEMIWF